MPDFEYTDHARDVMEERAIRLAWAEATIASPERTEPDATYADRRHALRRIPEHGDRVLRVIYTDSTESIRVLTAFFDRRMRGNL